MNKPNRLKDFFRIFFPALVSAFQRKPASDEITRAARRYYGLFFLALAVVLSTWMWTLENSSYATALDDLLRHAAEPPEGVLGDAKSWAKWFYRIDTWFFIACYSGFTLVMARFLRELLVKDLGLGGQGKPHWAVRILAPRLVWIALALLVLLVSFDLVENLTAISILKATAPDPLLSKWFDRGSTIKGFLELALGAVMLTAVLTWLLGGSIPVGNAAALNEARDHRRAVRDGVFDVLARTRYCLLTVLAYAVIMLGIDQAEDVLGALANFHQAEPQVAWTLVGAILLGMLALHTHAHAIWVWVRLLVRFRRPDTEVTNVDVAGTTFSKWWGRLLGAAPWFVVSVLCLRTAGQALQVEDADTAKWLLWGGGFASFWGIAFVLAKELESGRSHRKDLKYYSDETEEEDLLTDDAYRFLHKSISPSPLLIPLFAAAGILFIRYLYVHFPTNTACNALAAISFSFALWTCIINRLALNSLRSRVPWVLGLLVVIGFLAGKGCTQNHAVLAGENLANTGAGQPSLEHMFTLSVWLAAGAAAAYLVWTVKLLRKKKQRKTSGARGVADKPWHRWVLRGVVAAWTTGVLWWGSAGQPQQGAPQAALPERPPLEQAVRDWLLARLNECAATNCQRIPVYLVSAEGGGIRAAYYSGQLLSHLSEFEREGEATEGSLELSRRVFSLSGVSGGSLGVTGWRLCMERPKTPDCVAPLGGLDLLTPLASAWLFEDTLALVIPTGQCDLPGCGFVDRASWFERSLEKPIPAFAQPLPSGAPYLFLNSTWVETGERAIASNVEIESEDCVRRRHSAIVDGNYEEGWSRKCKPRFPTARDQLREIGLNARASTLAHNSARFPYFNPIGYVRDWGHLADGGYFDNSGTQTTVEILNEFARQLTCGGGGCERPVPEEAPGQVLDPVPRDALTPRDYRDLAQRVAFTAIMIRNGVRISSDPADSSCAAPRAKGSQSLFANAAGPLITALNATGIGTPNRVAQCNLQRVLTRLANTLPQQSDGGGYVDVRLVSEKTLYPLGWYLSSKAQDGIRAAASACVGGDGLGEILKNPTPIQDANKDQIDDRDAKKHDCFERVPIGVPPPASPEGRK